MGSVERGRASVAWDVGDEEGGVVGEEGDDLETFGKGHAGLEGRAYMSPPVSTRS